MMSMWKKSVEDKINSLITGISEKQRLNERYGSEVQHALLADSKNSLQKRNNALITGISEKRKTNERYGSEVQHALLADSKNSLQKRNNALIAGISEKQKTNERYGSEIRDNQKLIDSKKSLQKRNNSLITGISEKQKINERYESELQQPLGLIQEFEDRIKELRKRLDGIILKKTLEAVKVNDAKLKQLKSDSEKVQSDLDSARIDVGSKKSLQEKIDSLNDGIGKRQEINDQYRKTLKVEYFEEKIAETKRLLTSIQLDSEQRVTDALSTLDRVDLILEEIDPQIREAAIDQADKDRLLKETVRLKVLSEKWRNLAVRMSKAYNLLNNIRLQLGLDQEGKGGIFKKIKAAVFKYEYSINLIYATVAAIVGTFEIKPEYAPGYIKKYLEYDKRVFDYFKTHKKEYYNYIVKKTSIDGWLPKDSSEYDYYEPVLKELIELDSEVEYTGARAVLALVIPLFVILPSPFVIIPWMYMDRIQQIVGWFLYSVAAVPRFLSPTKRRTP